MSSGAAASSAEIPRHRTLRALITRPREEAVRLAAELARRGIDALVEPMMEIHFRSNEVLNLDGVQAVLCTSANGVRALTRVTEERDRLLLAVGDATASRARTEGFTNVASAGGSLTDLVRLAVMRLRPQGGQILHVAGDVVAGDLASALGEKGFTTERKVLYDARPIAALSRSSVRALCGRKIDFALFFSARTATIFVGLATGAGLAGCCRAITTLSISPAADAALSTMSWRDRHVAEKPTEAAMLAELDCKLNVWPRISS